MLFAGVLCLAVENGAEKKEEKKKKKQREKLTTNLILFKIFSYFCFCWPSILQVLLNVLGCRLTY